MLRLPGCELKADMLRKECPSAFNDVVVVRGLNYVIHEAQSIRPL